MFRTEQIITATQFVKSFPAIAKFLADVPQPLLISQKSGRFLVVLPAELFQYFASSTIRGEEPKDIVPTVRDYIFARKRI